MSSINFQERFGLTKGKAILIAILVVVFAAVLMTQFMPTNPGNSNRQKVAKPRKSRVKPKQKVAAKQVTPVLIQKIGTTSQTIWPVSSLDSALKFNPFVTPKALRPAPVENKESRAEQIAEQKRIQAEQLASKKKKELERQRIATITAKREKEQQLKKAEQERIKEVIRNLEAQGVDMFFSDGEKSVVKIGDRFLKQGDRFDGIEVFKIRDDGTVVLRPIQ